MSEAKRVFAYPQVSAEAHGLHLSIVGYGKEAWWPDGLGIKINELRRFVYGLRDDTDVVLFVDAYDVIFFGGEDEILRGFLEIERATGRSLVFNAEEICFPELPGICSDYPASPFPQWRHLNSGLFIGRVSALRAMLPTPVPDVIEGSDQAFYQRYFRSHQDLVALDYRCALLCAILSTDAGWGAELRGDGRIVNTVTGAVPAVVHFVSLAHWHYFRSDGVPTTTLHEVFRTLYPVASERLLDNLRLELNILGVHQHRLFESRDGGLRLYQRLEHTAKCFECRVLGTGERGCDDWFPSLLGGHCLLPTSLTLLALGLALCCAAACGCRSGARARPSKDSRKQD